MALEFLRIGSFLVSLVPAIEFVVAIVVETKCVPDSAPCRECYRPTASIAIGPMKGRLRRATCAEA